MELILKLSEDHFLFLGEWFLFFSNCIVIVQKKTYIQCLIEDLKKKIFMWSFKYDGALTGTIPSELTLLSSLAYLDLVTFVLLSRDRWSTTLNYIIFQVFVKPFNQFLLLHRETCQQGIDVSKRRIEFNQFVKLMNNSKGVPVLFIILFYSHRISVNLRNKLLLPQSRERSTTPPPPPPAQSQGGVWILKVLLQQKPSQSKIFFEFPDAFFFLFCEKVHPLVL